MWSGKVSLQLRGHLKALSSSNPVRCVRILNRHHPIRSGSFSRFTLLHRTFCSRPCLVRSPRLRCRCRPHFSVSSSLVFAGPWPFLRAEPFTRSHEMAKMRRPPELRGMRVGGGCVALIHAFKKGELGFCSDFLSSAWHPHPHPRKL